MKRLLALVLLITLSFSNLLPTAAHAITSSPLTSDGAAREESVTVGKEAIWDGDRYFLQDKSLFISQQGGAPSLLDSGDISWIILKGNNLYYAKILGYHTDIVVQDLLSNLSSVLCEVYYPVEAFDIASGFLYYLYNGEIVKQSLFDSSEEVVSFITEAGFYLDDHGNIHTLKVGRSDNECVDNDGDSTYLEPLVVGDISTILPIKSVSRVFSNYGMRPDPKSGIWKMHNGIDIVGSKEILAVADGTVVMLGRDTYAGNYVVLQHANGWCSVYCHLLDNSIVVKSNTLVKQGQKIATMGSTGYSTGIHLHFEVRNQWAGKLYATGYKNTIVDPLILVPSLETATNYRHFLNTSASGTYVTKLTATEQQWYYSRSPWYSNPNTSSAFKGNSISQKSIEGTVTNGAGVVFYKTTDGSYMEGSLFTTIYTRLSTIAPGNITYSDLVYPTGNLKLGQPFALHGTIASDKHNLASVVGAVVNANTGKEVMKATATPNTKKYDIYPGTVNKNLKFGTLPEGTYYLEYTVTDASGSAPAIWKSPNFQVVKSTAQTSAFPTIAASNILGGKQVTISCVDNNATIHYSINGGSEQTANSSVVLNYIAPGTYSISAYTTRSGYTSSAINHQTISVSKLTAPTISDASIGLSNATVTLTGNGVLYYTTDDSTPTTASHKYTAPLLLTESCTIQAISTEHGSAISEVAVKPITIAAPDKPVVSLYNTEAKIAQGRAATITWNNVERATSYTAQLYLGGESVGTYTTTGTYASFTLPQAGTYTLTVRAQNFVGHSDESTPVTVSSVAPLTVTILDRVDMAANVRDATDENGNPVSTQVQGNVIAVQKVPYGELPARLSVPLKVGYNFAGWSSAMYHPVYEDTTVYAEYEIRYYTVTFRDSNGNMQLTSQDVMYTASANAPTNYTVPDGYAFAGWSVDNAASEGADYQYVDGNMVLYSVYQWGNTELPTYLRINSVQRMDDLKTYRVNIGIKNNPTQDTDARLIISFETANGKTVYTQTEDLTLQEGGLNDYVNREIDLIYRDKISRVSAVIVDYDSINKKTGGTLSELASTTDIAAENLGWSNWSEWSPIYTAGDDVESKVQYRYQDKSTTTTNNTKSLPGWTYDYSTSSTGTWQETTTVVEAEDNDYRKREVTSSWVGPTYKTQYRYGRWTNGSRIHFCPVLGKQYHGGTWYTQFTAWSDYASAVDKATKYYCSGTTHDHRHPDHYSGSVAYWYSYQVGGNKYYWQETQQVQVAPGYTLYRYRDTHYTHYFHNWSEWSAWADSSIASSATRNVETRTVYRYRNIVYGNDPGTGSEEPTDTEYQVSGVLSTDQGTDFAGKIATVLVYRKTNTDPTNEQLEYVSQVTIAPGNAYAFVVKPKEKADYNDTGDFVVALALEGCNKLIDVEIIKAPIPTHTISFVADGEVIGTQKVPKYGAADVYTVEAPEKPGYTFVKWSASATNVTKDMSVYAIYKKNTYAVVFVDHENHTAELKLLEYGNVVATPEVTPIDGKVFLGWDKITNQGDTTVQGHTVMTALWEDIEYTVSFVDFAGNVISQQSVAYGRAATMPEFYEHDGVVYTWSLVDGQWWDVKQDMIIHPYVHNERTTVAPTTNVEPSEGRGMTSVELQTSTPGGAIYYCLDFKPTEDDIKNFVADKLIGQEPEVGVIELQALEDEEEEYDAAEILEYTEPIAIYAGTTLWAFTMDSQGNTSEAVAFDYSYDYLSEDLGIIQNSYVVDAESPQIVVSNVQTTGGQTVTVPLHIVNNPGTLKLKLSPQFNQQGLTLIDVTNGDVFANNEFSFNTTGDGAHELVWEAPASNSTNGLLATLVFKTHDSAVDASYDITLAIQEAYDAEQAVVYLAPVAGMLDVAAGSSMPLICTTSFKVGAQAAATALAPNELLVANMTVTNNSDTAQQVLLVVALYNPHGTMESVVFASRNTLPAQTEQFSAGFKLPANVVGYKVKAFLWDGTDIDSSNMIPLSKVFALEAE